MTDWPSLSPDRIVRKAREFLGTPYHHDARLKGVGVDCAGLIACTFDELGVSVPDKRGYGFDADNFEVLRGGVAALGDPVGSGPWMPGDMILFRARLMFNHCGFYTGDGLIHAYSSPCVMAVAEHPMDESWLLRVADVYRYRGIAL